MRVIQRADIAKNWHWLAFFLLQGFNLYQVVNHTMWRDELQTWSLVRESTSIVQLAENMRYEGFPPLWFLFLWVLSRFTSAPLAMQLFHFACSFLTQLLVMTRAPFSANMRLAIIGGYFFSFEYCIISRAYVLGILFLFLFCAFYSWLDEHPVWKGLFLGLLANTSVYGAIISLAFLSYELPALVRRRWSSSRGGIISFALVYVILFAVAVSFMLPPADGTYAAGWIFNPDLKEKLYLLCRNLISLVPVPTPKVQFWNSLAFMDAGLWVAIPVSVAVVAALWCSLREDSGALRIFIIGFAGIWLFGVIKYVGTVRHVGAGMVLFIACLWRAAQARPPASIPAQSRTIAVWGLLVINVTAGVVASWYHLRHDFSGSREMAKFIQGTATNAVPIIADADFAASSVAGYLNRPLLYASNRKPQTFIHWNTERIGGGPEDTLDFAAQLTQVGYGRILLLLNYPLEADGLRLLSRTADTIVNDETFYLYEYSGRTADPGPVLPLDREHE